MCDRSQNGIDGAAVYDPKSIWPAPGDVLNLKMVNAAIGFPSVMNHHLQTRVIYKVNRKSIKSHPRLDDLIGTGHIFLLRRIQHTAYDGGQRVCLCGFWSFPSRLWG